MALKLGSITDAQTGVIKIVDPETGADTGATITLAGPENPLRKAREWERAKVLRARMFAEGKFSAPDLEDEQAAKTELLVASTLAWDGIEDASGPVVMTAAAARALYTDPAHQWLRRQVEDALGKRELFIGRSATA